MTIFLKRLSYSVLLYSYQAVVTMNMSLSKKQFPPSVKEEKEMCGGNISKSLIGRGGTIVINEG